MRPLPEDEVTRIYRETIRPLYTYVSRRVGGDIGLAEDFVQEAWMRDDVRAGIVASLGDEAARVLRPDGTGRWLLDLWSANRKMLTRAGVPDSQIHVAAVPTGPDQPGDPGVRGKDSAEGGDTAGGGLFFSDRTARPCGRFALVARLTGGDPTATPITGRRSR